MHRYLDVVPAFNLQPGDELKFNGAKVVRVASFGPKKVQVHLTSTTGAPLAPVWTRDHLVYIWRQGRAA